MYATLGRDRKKRLPPWERLQLNRRCSLAEGLKHYALARSGVGPLVDLVRPRPSRPKVVSATTPVGPGCGDNAVFTNAETTDLAFTSGGWTVAAFFYQTAALANGDFVSVFSRQSYSSEATNAGWSLELRPPDDNVGGVIAWRNKFQFFCYNNNGHNSYGDAMQSSTSHGEGVWSLVGASLGTGTQRNLYVNGKLDGFSVTTNVVCAPSSGNTIVSWHYGGNTTRVKVLMTAAWGRCLSDEEIADLSNYPFMIAEPVQSSVYLPLAAPLAIGGASVLSGFSTGSAHILGG